jgi:farnesyl-diphosphate farnesyltransferase
METLTGAAGGKLYSVPSMAASTEDLLKATARSFYLTLRVLPGQVRAQIGLAYLLARTADTIADTGIVPAAQRLEVLRRFRQRLSDRAGAPLALGELAQQQGSPAEKLLLERIEESLTALGGLSSMDQKLIQDVLAVIISGQELDLQRFTGVAAVGGPGGKPVMALQTAAELDDYTYRVAGCVGEFWTRLCRAHLFPNARLNDIQLIADGIRFGQGLQLVNILRDLPADWQQGRCYLPREKLAAAGLTLENLWQPEHAAAFLGVFRAHLDVAEAHLAAGWRYNLTLPFGQFRVRLACAWPLLLGVKTIKKMRGADVAALRGRVKVSRPEVYALLARSTLACPIPFLWRQLYHPGAKAIASAADLA